MHANLSPDLSEKMLPINPSFGRSPLTKRPESSQGSFRNALISKSFIRGTESIEVPQMHITAYEFPIKAKIVKEKNRPTTRSMSARSKGLKPRKKKSARPSNRSSKEQSTLDF